MSKQNFKRSLMFKVISLIVIQTFVFTSSAVAYPALGNVSEGERYLRGSAFDENPENPRGFAAVINRRQGALAQRELLEEFEQQLKEGITLVYADGHEEKIGYEEIKERFEIIEGNRLQEKGNPSIIISRVKKDGNFHFEGGGIADWQGRAKVPKNGFLVVDCRQAETPPKIAKDIVSLFGDNKLLEELHLFSHSGELDIDSIEEEISKTASNVLIFHLAVSEDTKEMREKFVAGVDKVAGKLPEPGNEEIKKSAAKAKISVDLLSLIPVVKQIAQIREMYPGVKIVFIHPTIMPTMDDSLSEEYLDTIIREQWASIIGEEIDERCKPAPLLGGVDKVGLKMVGKPIAMEEINLQITRLEAEKSVIERISEKSSDLTDWLKKDIAEKVAALTKEVERLKKEKEILTEASGKVAYPVILTREEKIDVQIAALEGMLSGYNEVVRGKHAEHYSTYRKEEAFKEMDYLREEIAIARKEKVNSAGRTVGAEFAGLTDEGDDTGEFSNSEEYSTGRYFYFGKAVERKFPGPGGEVKVFIPSPSRVNDKVWEEIPGTNGEMIRKIEAPYIKSIRLSEGKYKGCFDEPFIDEGESGERLPEEKMVLPNGETVLVDWRYYERLPGRPIIYESRLEPSLRIEYAKLDDGAYHPEAGFLLTPYMKVKGEDLGIEYFTDGKTVNFEDFDYLPGTNGGVIFGKANPNNIYVRQSKISPIFERFQSGKEENQIEAELSGFLGIGDDYEYVPYSNGSMIWRSNLPSVIRKIYGRGEARRILPPIGGGTLIMAGDSAAKTAERLARNKEIENINEEIITLQSSMIGEDYEAVNKKIGELIEKRDRLAAEKDIEGQEIKAEFVRGRYLASCFNCFPDIKMIELNEKEANDFTDLKNKRAIIIKDTLLLDNPGAALAIMKLVEQLDKEKIEGLKIVLAIGSKEKEDDLYQAIRQATKGIVDLKGQFDLVVSGGNLGRLVAEVKKKLGVEQIALLAPRKQANNYKKDDLGDCILILCNIGDGKDSVYQGDLALLVALKALAGKGVLTNDGKGLLTAFGNDNKNIFTIHSKPIGAKAKGIVDSYREVMDKL